MCMVASTGDRMYDSINPLERQMSLAIGEVHTFGKANVACLTLRAERRVLWPSTLPPAKAVNLKRRVWSVRRIVTGAPRENRLEKTPEADTLPGSSGNPGSSNVVNESRGSVSLFS